MLLRKTPLFVGLVPIFLVASSSLANSDFGLNGTVSEEFDMPRIGETFKTSPPEGPSTTVLTDETNRRVTSSRWSTRGVRYRDARPGVRQTLTRRRQGRRESGSFFYSRTTQHPSKFPRTCQYIFTVENAAECTHSSTEIAVHHVTRAILPSPDTLQEVSQRLRMLEKAVYGSVAPSTTEPMLRDGVAIAEINVHHEEGPTITNESAKEDSQSENDNLVEIAQELIKQLVALEKGITRSEKVKKDLRTQNKNLIIALRRAAVARRNLVSLKTNLENSLRRLREDNTRLLSTNRTMAQQNSVLKSQNEKLESVQESFRSRIRSLEMQFEQIEKEFADCGEQRSILISEKGHLQIRVNNLTSMAERCMKISYEDESTQYELEKQREKNEILVAENSELEKQLENATMRIEQLLEEKRQIVSTRALDFTVETSGPRDDQDYSYCGRISSISVPETIRTPHSFLEKHGVWMMDPLEALGGGKVWSINTVKDRVKELKQYGSLRKFVLNQPELVMSLPVLVENNGGVIYNGSFYYQRRNSRKLVRYDMRLKRVLRERPVHRAGFHATFAYQWGGLTDIDLAVDEFGLWVIYGTRQNNGNIVIARINPVTLRPILTMKTSIPKRAVANAFMACGILYTVDSYDSANASLNHEFDTYRKRSRKISIPFANQHRFNVMVDYNPRTREIFSWDNSHQVKYYVTLDKTFGKITELTRRQRRRKRG